MGFLKDIAGSALGAAATLFGGKMAADAQKDASGLSKEALQHGIRWRVRDAKAAGIHPLFALGANIPSYSPVVQDAMPQAIAQAGQMMGSAIENYGRKADPFARRQAERAERLSEAQTVAAEEQAIQSRFETQRMNLQYNEDIKTGFGRSAIPGQTGSLPSYISKDAALPLFQRYNTSLGTVLLPAQEGSEALEGAESAIGAALILHANYESGYKIPDRIFTDIVKNALKTKSPTQLMDEVIAIGGKHGQQINQRIRRMLDL